MVGGMFDPVVSLGFTYTGTFYVRNGHNFSFSYYHDHIHCCNYNSKFSVIVDYVLTCPDACGWQRRELGLQEL